MLMVLIENFHVLNCRSETQSLFRIPIKNNYFLFVTILLAQGLHITASYIPFLADILQLEPIQLHEWMKLVPTAAIILIAIEIFKWWRKAVYPVVVSQAEWLLPAQQRMKIS
jgi:magnesium-transporting ATPase (P-type)